MKKDFTNSERKGFIRTEKQGFISLALLAVIAIIAGVAIIVANNSNFLGDLRSHGQTTSSSVTLNINAAGDLANEVDGTLTTSEPWLGNGGSPTASYLGMRFSGATLPQGAHIDSAKINFSPKSTQWISVGAIFKGQTESVTSGFSSSSLPSVRFSTTASTSFSDNVKWETGQTYNYDVTAVVQELVNSSTHDNVVIIAKGTSGKWGRKFILQPSLTVAYTTSTVNPSPVPSPTLSPVPSPTPSPSVAPSPSPIVSILPSPVASPSIAPSPIPSPVASPISSIYGAVGADTLGTCTSAVHDRFVTTGPDGLTYRTWHPQTVLIDPNNQGLGTCTFGHEHGDDPATSNIFRGAVAFDYVARQNGMDEPHVGFKCFVQNKNTSNEEGTIMLHDSYYCFHMGTGGAARFSARFHSMEYHVLTSAGARMDLQGLSDVGNVGSICDDPRQQRTVEAYGCVINSPYEIWEAHLNITNQGNLVAQAITSTGVFDPITVMDPIDKTRLIYAWDPSTLGTIFKFNNDRTASRGCNREAYSGPDLWYNANGSQTYYTDVYGNIVNGGVLKQTVSNVSMNRVGPLTSFGGLIMGYKPPATSDPQTQFKLHNQRCAPGLGVKN